MKLLFNEIIYHQSKMKTFFEINIVFNLFN